MSDSDNRDDSSFGIHFVQNSVIADANPVLGSTLQFLGSNSERINGQSVHCFQQALEQRVWKRPHLFANSGWKLNLKFAPHVSAPP